MSVEELKPTRNWRDDALRYVLAAMFVAAAFVLLLLVPAIQAGPFMLFIVAVALSARYAGYGPALIAAVVSAGIVAYAFLPPRYSLTMSGTDALRTIMFLGTTILIAQLAKQSSKARRIAEEVRERAATIVECSEDAVLSKDMDGIITSWNAGAERLYGYTAEEVIGRHVSMLAPPEQADEVQEIMRRLRAGQRIGHYQTQRQRKDGSRMMVSLSISPLRDSEGRITGASAFAHDITAQKEAELRLHEAQEDLAAAYERLTLTQQAANIGTWEWNLQTGEVTWSPELEAIHGFAAGTSGCTFEECMATVHPEDREMVRKHLLSAISDGSPYNVEYRTVCPDGTVHWAAARGKVFLGANGSPLKMMGICLDISSSKKAEEALRRSEKLAATGRLAASIAHEINNPLESIMNLVFLAKNDARLSPESRQYLELADKELVRVAHLAKQTLGFYRDTSAAVPVRVSAILDEVLELYARRLESKEIVAERDYVSEIHVLGSEGEIRQVFSNLVANAIDAMPARGRLRVRISQSHEWTNSLRPGVRVTVADSGCGITREAQARIFEPFYTTKEDVGIGLGLWLTRTIVEKHGGMIHVRSRVTPGRSGTVFSVFLPVGAAELVRAA